MDNSKYSTSRLCDSKTAKKEEEEEKCAAPRPTICQTFPLQRQMDKEARNMSNAHG